MTWRNVDKTELLLHLIKYDEKIICKEKNKKMIQLAPKKLCTGCGACAFVCGKNCIVMKENEVGIVYPELEMSNCVQCERCQKVCPIIENVDFRKPLTAYAAWSSNENERATSASGGIASEI